MTDKTLGSAKISTKGQVTVPIVAREKFDLMTGDLLLFVEKDGELVIRKG
jgi:AbrB family looped-hinge helix DNA binding protein